MYFILIENKRFKLSLLPNNVHEFSNMRKYLCVFQVSPYSSDNKGLNTRRPNSNLPATWAEPATAEIHRRSIFLGLLIQRKVEVINVILINAVVRRSKE